MTWYAAYNKKTGRLYSLGSVVPKSLPAELMVKESAEQPDLGKVMWDPAIRDFVPVPAEPPDSVKEAVRTFADLDTSAMTQPQTLAFIVKGLKFLVKKELSRG